MRVKSLKIRNIGPFKEADLEFISNDFEMNSPPVICITGENGTGKSIIIDAIRALLKGHLGGGIERDIVSFEPFLLESDIHINNHDLKLTCHKKFNKDRNALDTNSGDLSNLFVHHLKSSLKKDFIFDYWTSKLSSDSFNISNITAIEANKYLDDVLSGVHRNVDLTKTISFFDYLKDSRSIEEKNLGESLYKILEEIINISISNGRLSHVSRINLKPIIKVGSIEITLDKLSSGNLYLMQRFASLVSQIYSISVLNDIPISNFKNIKGLLLIDEAENHLHPKWQKVFLQNILKLFPKLQIIVSTHSPFIVSSVSNCRVFACKSELDHSIVTEETDFYSNKPIEEILLSPLFNTRNFNAEISNLLDLRKKALERNSNEEIKSIEDQLLELNPEYFYYLNLEKIIKSIKNERIN